MSKEKNFNLNNNQDRRLIYIIGTAAILLILIFGYFAIEWLKDEIIESQEIEQTLTEKYRIKLDLDSYQEIKEEINQLQYY